MPPRQTPPGTSTDASANKPFAQGLAVAAAASGPVGVFGTTLAGLSLLGVLPVPKGGNPYGYAVIGCALMGLSLWWQNHRAMRMAVTVAASSEISRAQIANAVTPDSVVVTPSSPDEAVQRGIVKQLAGETK